MAQQTIVCDYGLKEWGDWINANYAPRTDDDVTRDLHGQPMSAEQILEADVHVDRLRERAEGLICLRANRRRSPDGNAERIGRGGHASTLSGSIGLISLVAACALAVGGCGSAAVNSTVDQTAQAACLAASASIKDPAAKHSADQACRAVGSGKSKQLIRAGIEAARQACLQVSQQITDPTARAAAKAACPAGK